MRCVEYIPFSSVQFKSNGAVKQQSEQGIAPSKNEIDYLLAKAQANADYYALEITKLLNCIFKQYSSILTKCWKSNTNISRPE
jgi:hypothetical protein